MAVLADDVVAIAYATTDGTTLTGFDMLSRGEQRWSRTDPFVEGVTYVENDMSLSLFRSADLLAYAPNGGPLPGCSSAAARSCGTYTDVIGVGQDSTGWMSDEDGRISWTVWESARAPHDAGGARR